MPFTIGGLAVGAGLGVLKLIQDGNQAGQQAKVQAATTRYSPWTGMQAAAPTPVNAVGDIMGGMASGGMQGQALGNSLNKVAPLAMSDLTNASGDGALDMVNKFNEENKALSDSADASELGQLGGSGGAADADPMSAGNGFNADSKSLWANLKKKKSSTLGEQ